MKILSSTLFGAVVLAAAPAFAADHLMRVTEVLLGGTTHADSQYVELSDPGEPFPASYNFVTYDSTGTSISAQTLAITAQTTRVVLANASAQDEFSLTTGEVNHVMVINLQNVMPAVGAVCFRRQDGDSPDNPGTRIHCLGWGNATSFPTSTAGTDHGDAPAAGMSLQKLSGCTIVAAPSPNATNTATCPVAGDNLMPPDDGQVDPQPDADEGSGGDDDGNPDNGKGGGGCNVGAGAGWLGLVGIAGLAIGGRSIRRRKRR